MPSDIDVELCRLTVVGPAQRMDLVVPVAVPLAELLPAILTHFGENPPGWLLCRATGEPLDTAGTAQELGLRHGDLLLIRSLEGPGQAPDFDDPAEAVARATEQRPDRWRAEHDSRFWTALAFAGLLAGVLAAALLPSRVAVIAVAFGCAAVLVVATTALSRIRGNSAVTTALGVAALGYTGVGGLAGPAPILAPGQLGPAQLLAASVAILVTSLVLAFAGPAARQGGRPGGQRPLFFSTAAAAAVLAIASAARLVGVPTTTSAAIIAVLTFAALPLLPAMALRFAGIGVPTIPDEPGADTGDDDVTGVLDRTAQAHRLLAISLATAGVVMVAAAAVFAIGGGLPGVLLCTALGLLLWLRARELPLIAHRLPLLLGGAAMIVLALIGGYRIGSDVLPSGVILLLLNTLALLCLAFAASAGRRSPWRGRAADLFELALIVGLLPIVAWICGVYRWIGMA